jgi:hypothetical protein
MDNITFDDMDEFVIRRIFEIFYNDYDIMSINKLSAISEKFGAEYKKKHYNRNQNDYEFCGFMF